jgi:hypothetical protein
MRFMNRKVGLITFLVFLLFVAAGVVAVVSLGTSTGLQMGGKVVASGVGTVESPYRAQAGWIRNNSPWPVTISAIDVNDAGTVEDPQIFLSETNDEPDPVAGETPVWATTPVTLPYTLEGGALRYFGFGMVPEAGAIASFDKITVTFTGPVPFQFSSDYTGVVLGGAATNLAPELVAQDPSEDEGSIDRYVGVLRAALASGNLEQLQSAMGEGTTPEQATALRDSQVGFAAEMPVDSDVITRDSRSWTIRFYATDPAVDALPAISVKWDNFRWHASVAG